MPEKVTFIPYAVVAASMAINHPLAGAVKLEKPNPPAIDTEWVRPIQLGRPFTQNRQPQFVFLAVKANGDTVKITMFPERSDSTGSTGRGEVEPLPPDSSS